MANEELIDHIAFYFLSQYPINLDNYRGLLFPGELNALIQINSSRRCKARLEEKTPKNYQWVIFGALISDYTDLMQRPWVTLSYNICKFMIFKEDYIRTNCGNFWPIDDYNIIRNMVCKGYFDEEFNSIYGEKLLRTTQNLRLCDLLLTLTDLNERNNSDYLHYAIQRQSIEKIKWVIQNIPGINYSDYVFGRSDLNTEVVYLMLRKGVRPEKIFIRGIKLIIYLLLDDDREILFDEVGLNINYYLQNSFKAIIAIIDRYPWLDEHHKWLYTSLNFDIKNYYGDNILTYICRNRYHIYMIVSFLLSLGIDINYRGYRGYTALHILIIRNRYQEAKFLLDNGANPNISNKRGRYPLDSVRRAPGKDALQMCHWLCTKLGGLYFTAMPNDITRELRKYL